MCRHCLQISASIEIKLFEDFAKTKGRYLSCEDIKSFYLISIRLFFESNMHIAIEEGNDKLLESIMYTYENECERIKSKVNQ